MDAPDDSTQVTYDPAAIPRSDTEGASQFEIVGIPNPVLAGPEGQIVATRSELIGEDLTTTLKKLPGPGDDAAGEKESN